MSIFGIAKRGFGMLKKAGKGKEWDILKKHPTLANQSYSKSAVNKMLSKKEPSDKPFGESQIPGSIKAYQQRPNFTGKIKTKRKKLKAKKKD